MCKSRKASSPTLSISPVNLPCVKLAGKGSAGSPGKMNWVTARIWISKLSSCSPPCPNPSTGGSASSPRGSSSLAPSHKVNKGENLLDPCQHLAQEGQSVQGSSSHPQISGFTLLPFWDAKYYLWAALRVDPARGADTSLAAAFLHLQKSYGRGALSPSKSEL